MPIDLGQVAFEEKLLYHMDMVEEQTLLHMDYQKGLGWWVVSPSSAAAGSAAATQLGVAASWPSARWMVVQNCLMPRMDPYAGQVAFLDLLGMGQV